MGKAPNSEDKSIPSWPEANTSVSRLLDADPDEGMTVEEAILHPFLQNIPDEERMACSSSLQNQ
ncbi:hypothetical protein BGX33_001896 [Mortierella sp. NVP41]|nr:hypothetical protein BGX33_001896 [Mortierella sp. NVP41]